MHTDSCRETYQSSRIANDKRKKTDTYLHVTRSETSIICMMYNIYIIHEKKPILEIRDNEIFCLRKPVNVNFLGRIAALKIVVPIWFVLKPQTYHPCGRSVTVSSTNAIVSRYYYQQHTPLYGRIYIV